jgi:hypothetical protein
MFFASIPCFDCLVRREYTRNLRDGHDDCYEAKAIGIACHNGVVATMSAATRSRPAARLTPANCGAVHPSMRSARP